MLIQIIAWIGKLTRQEKGKSFSYQLDALASESVMIFSWLVVEISRMGDPLAGASSWYYLE